MDRWAWCFPSHSWEFSTEAGGVKYSIVQLEDGAQTKGHREIGRVRDPERVDSHLQAVAGETVVQEPGLYCLQIRSKLSSDKLSYIILATPPPDCLWSLSVQKL